MYLYQYRIKVFHPETGDQMHQFSVKGMPHDVRKMIKNSPLKESIVHYECEDTVDGSSLGTGYLKY